MSTKTIIFAAVAGFIVLLVISLFLVFWVKPSPQTPTGNIPAPTTESLTGAPSLLSFRLVKTSPPNNGVNVNTASPVSFEFNKSVADTSPAITFSPQAQFNYTFSQNTLIITPTAALTPATTYTVTVKLAGQTFFTVFNTTGPTPTIGKSTFNPGAAEKDTAYLKENRPDIFISNYVPYTGATFSVADDYSTGQDRFVFTVTAKNSGVEVKQDFLNWVKSKGLNDTQASNLIVSYK